MARRALEGVAHTAALGLLAWLLLRTISAAGVGPPERARSSALPAALARWSTVDRPARVRAVVDGELSPAASDWLAALRRSGTPVAWEGAPAPVAAVDDPVADPAGAARVLVATPAGAPVVLDDRVGRLDSLTAGRTGAAFLVRSGPPWVRVRTGGLAASAAMRDSLVLGRLLLLGRVGWEAKFVAAALEERGWKVDARLALSPRGDVTQGGAARLDTNRYSAVIVLDSVASGELAGIQSYLRSGGGAVLTAAALRAPVLRALGAAREGAVLGGVEPFDTAAEPRASLALVPIADWSGQLTLETRAGRPAVVARRVERGRLMIVGYQDTWRWRMSGRGDAAEQHREWWSGLVSGVARAGRAPRSAPADNVDEAPLARLMDRLGPAAPSEAAVGAGLAVSDGLLFGLMAGLLLLGWASRRLRGAP